MYEWKDVPLEKPFARFVQFSPEDPEKIEYYNGKGPLIGVTSIQSTITSDDPNEWKYAYMCSEVGDRFLNKETLAVGVKQYDQIMELSYITTRPYTHFKTIPNKAFKEEFQYQKRSQRPEWCRVNLIGKAIVEDNGDCVPGQYCEPCVSELNIECGKAIPWKGESKQKFWVLRRLTDTTIEVLNSPMFFA